MRYPEWEAARRCLGPREAAAAGGRGRRIRMLVHGLPGLIVGLALAASAAPAEDASRRGDAGKSVPAKLETVVVTARRREEAAQDVPLSVTTMDGAELEARGAADITAIGMVTPNLVIYPARAFNGTLTAYIRGVGQSDPIWGVEPGVAVYVDDVYLARPQAALLEILDVQRIEVLRGPQGTLYGKNSIGGAIKYVTMPPDDVPGGRVVLTAGSYARRDAKAIVNLPLGERLRSRVAVGSFDRDGFGTNLLTGRNVSAKDTSVARVSAEWLPVDDLAVRFAYDSYRDRSGEIGAQRLQINPFDPARTPPNRNPYDVQSDRPDIDEMDAEGGSVVVDWTPAANWGLRSITAHRGSDSRGGVDFDTLPLQIATLERRFDDSQTSQEIQLHWDGARDHLVAGFYGFDGDAGGVGSTSSMNAVFVRTQGKIDTRSGALYGNLTHEFDPLLALELGLRYTRERKRALVFSQRYSDRGLTVPEGPPYADFSDSKDYESLSPRINLSYRASETALLYAQVARGSKSGTFNVRANTLFVPESALPLEDESALTYELGAKTQWLDDRLSANLALFRNDYRDIQLSVATTYDSDGDGIDDEFFGDFLNAGAGTIDGAELELSAQTGPALSWLGHLAYLDARYDEYVSAGVDIADQQRFANAPRWQAGISAIAEAALSSGAVLSARVEGRYQSKVYPTTDLSEAIAQDGYALWNAMLAWTSPAGTWEVALNGQNLGNKAYHITGFNFPTAGVLTAYLGPPRTVALTVNWRF